MFGVEQAKLERIGPDGVRVVVRVKLGRWERLDRLGHIAGVVRRTGEARIRGKPTTDASGSPFRRICLSTRETEDSSQVSMKTFVARGRQ